MSAGSPRRTDALSKERIVAVAIEILDAEGEAALTFRTLATRLSTGSGALYHHVANKHDLLAATTDEVIATAVAAAGHGAEPRDTIRAVAAAVFDAIRAHPWAGTQLSVEPWQPAALRILEGVGAPLRALGVEEVRLFDSATALLSFVLGLAGQYAARARRLAPGTDRSEFLGDVARRWHDLDPATHPFVRSIAPHLADHDDREQFLAGVDLILAGIATSGS